MKTIVTGLAFLISAVSQSGFSQNSHLERLKLELSGTPTDKRKIIILDSLAYGYNFINADTAAFYANEGFQLAESNNDSGSMALLQIPLSSSLAVQGNYPLALHYIINAISYFERKDDTLNLAWANGTLSYIYKEMGDYERAMKNMHETGERMDRIINNKDVYSSYAFIFDKAGNADSVLYYGKKTIDLGLAWSGLTVAYANAYNKKGLSDSALFYYQWSIADAKKVHYSKDLVDSYNGIAKVYQKLGKYDSAKFYLQQVINEENIEAYPVGKLMAYETYSKIYDAEKNSDSALYYLKKFNVINEQLFSKEKQNAINNIFYARDIQIRELEKAKREYKNQLTRNLLTSGLIVLLLASGLLIWNIRQKQRSLVLIGKEKREVEIQKGIAEAALEKLQLTQQQLIQSEKLASLGQLTSGIAHEIQNPLNFVNNFSELNHELFSEVEREIETNDHVGIKNLFKSIMVNNEKILLHGKRADAIVKSMLQHAQSGSGQKEPVNINTLTDEMLRLSYQSIISKDSTFRADIKKSLDEKTGIISISPQDISRVMVNIYNNAFYSMSRKRLTTGENYFPEISLTTMTDAGKIYISIGDNGMGMNEEVKKKIFQPFFTTKPTGEGTGLGLSLSYDIVKAMGGTLQFNSVEGKGSEFIIQLPLTI